MRRQLTGLGGRNLALNGLAVVRFASGLTLQGKRLLLIPPGKILPLPTSLRAVSGSQKTIKVKHSPERMLRNQKIHRQLAFSARTPPRTGPRLGAVFGLRSSESVLTRFHQHGCTYPHNAAPMYLPRSCGGARSATTLMASAMVPMLSVTLNAPRRSRVPAHPSFRCSGEPSGQAEQGMSSARLNRCSPQDKRRKPLCRRVVCPFCRPHHRR